MIEKGLILSRDRGVSWQIDRSPAVGRGLAKSGLVEIRVGTQRGDIRRIILRKRDFIGEIIAKNINVHSVQRRRSAATAPREFKVIAAGDQRYATGTRTRG